MIVVTTPTGRVGRQVLGRIPDGGKPVRVVARDPSRLDPQTRGRIARALTVRFCTKDRTISVLVNLQTCAGNRVGWCQRGS